MAFTVLYDACCLYPAPLRDLLMHVALTDIVRAKWTDAIHDEWIRNLLKKRPDIKPEGLERTRQLMNAHVRDCLVTEYEQIIECLHLPDDNDRHVLAAAIKARVDVIVTFNLRDFPQKYLKQFGIEAQHPDEFLVDLLDLSFDKLCLAVQRHRSSLKNPPKSAAEYLDTMRQEGLPSTCAKLLVCQNII